MLTRRTLLAIATAPAAAPRTASAIDRETVSWDDDFLGDEIDARYHASTALGGYVSISSDEDLRGGWLKLTTAGQEGSAARLRLGTDEDDDGKHHLQWWTTQNASAEGLVRLNGAIYGQATFGLVGKNDPHNVLGAALWRPAGTYAPFGRQPAQWWFQVAANNRHSIVPTRYAPERPTWIRIETGPTASKLWMDGVLRAAVADNIPEAGGVFEFQVWSDRTKDGTFWPTTMWVDCVSIWQTRQRHG